jgi:hypothetical protein
VTGSVPKSVREAIAQAKALLEHEPKDKNVKSHQVITNFDGESLLITDQIHPDGPYTFRVRIAEIEVGQVTPQPDGADLSACSAARSNCGNPV